jgi:hypothetical protein
MKDAAEVKRFSSRPSGIGRAVLVHGVAVAIPMLVQYGFGDPALTLKVGGITMLPVYTWLGLQEGRRASPWLSPLSFYFLWYATSLGLSSIYHGFVIASRGSIPFAGLFVGGNDLAAGYLVFLLGSLMLHIGIQLRRPAQSTATPGLGFMTSSPRLSWFIALWGLGLYSSLVVAPGTPLGSLSAILQVLALSVMMLYGLIPHQALKLSRFTYWTLFALGILGVLWGQLATYSKAFILFSFMPVISAFWVRRRLRKFLPVAVFVIASIGLLIVYPVMNVARSTPLEPGENPSDRLVAVFLSQKTEEVFADPDDTVEEYLQRQFDPAPVGFLVGEVNITGYLGGETLALLPAALIPRALWPNKPSVTQGAWFTFYLGSAASPDAATTSIGMTATGELYWNFGVFGVVIGMFLIGLAIGTLWRLAGPDPRRSPFRMLLYLVLTLNMPNMAEAVSTLAGLIATGALFVFLLKVVPTIAIDERPGSRVSVPTH